MSKRMETLLGESKVKTNKKLNFFIKKLFSTFSAFEFYADWKFIFDYV